jgi:hypothetical protein
MALALAFLLGAITAGPAWLLFGAIIADTLTVRRHRRRRATIDLEGPDAVESWLAGIENPKPANGNGTPWPEEEQTA